MLFALNAYGWILRTIRSISVHPNRDVFCYWMDSEKLGEQMQANLLPEGVLVEAGRFSTPCRGNAGIELTYTMKHYDTFGAQWMVGFNFAPVVKNVFSDWFH